MLQNEYTITWTSSSQAVFSWDAGSDSSWWTLYVDGRRAFSIYGYGVLSRVISIREEEVHSVSLISHSGEMDDVKCPESLRLLRPVVRWLAVTNAAEYQVKQIGADDVEYLRAVIPMDENTQVFSWEVPTNLPQEGLDSARFKVYARNSGGLNEVVSTISGLVVGYPPAVYQVDPVDDSVGGLQLVLTSIEGVLG